MNKKRDLSVLDDQPASEDFLHYDTYVQTFKELIANDKTETPLTLGIFGKWGTGKTTLMHMLEQEIKREGITTVWFKAWLYSKEDELWAAFLQSILNKVQDEFGSFRRLVFRIRIFFKRINWPDVPGLLIQYVLRIVIVVIPLLLIDPVTQQIQPTVKPIIQLGGSVIAFGLAIWIVIKPLISAVRESVTINFDDFMKGSDYREHIAFLDQFREHFADVVQCLPGKANKHLAVFIDDLDRCPADRILQVLDAIKSFVDTQGCIYILGMDVNVVNNALMSKYKDDSVAQHEYLGKIIQLPFQLPLLSRDEMHQFIEKLAPDLPHEECRRTFVAGLAVNPREIKRTINVFSFLWTLANNRKELTNLIHPVRLAKVVVIQHSYPELHRILQQEPNLLIQLEEFFRDEDGEEGKDRSKDPLIKDNTTALSALPLELHPFVGNKDLRRMLLLHKLSKPYIDNTDDKYSFVTLEADNVTVYFTLTNLANRTEDATSIASGLPSITIGRPEWWHFTNLVEEEKLSPEIMSRLPEFDFYLVRLACAVRSKEGQKIRSARLIVQMYPRKGEVFPIVFDMYPHEVLGEDETSSTIAITPSLKFEGVEKGLQEAKVTLTLPPSNSIITGFGVGDSTAYWNFHARNNHSLIGSNFVYFILMKPRVAESVRLNLGFTAVTETKFGPISVGPPQEFGQNLSFEITSD